MRENNAASVLCCAGGCRSCARNRRAQRRFGDLAQPNRNQVFAQQCCACRFFLVRCEKKRTDCLHAPRIDVSDTHWLSAVGGAIQRAWMERVLCSPAVSLLARAAWSLERRTCNHGGFDPKRGRLASRCYRSAPTDWSVARGWLQRIRSPWDKLRWVDRCFTRNGRARFAIRRADVSDRECRTRNLAESRNGIHAARITPREDRTRIGGAAFSSELATAQQTGVRPGARALCVG